MLQFLGAYLIRSVMLGHPLFKDPDVSVQEENGLKVEMNEMEDSQEVNITSPTSKNKRITSLKKYLKTSSVALYKVEHERDSLLRDC